MEVKVLRHRDNFISLPSGGYENQSKANPGDGNVRLWSVAWLTRYGDHSWTQNRLL